MREKIFIKHLCIYINLFYIIHKCIKLNKINSLIILIV